MSKLTLLTLLVIYVEYLITFSPSAHIFLWSVTLWSIRRHLDMDSDKLLVTVVVSSHRDYCNSLLYGMADIVLTRLHACTKSTGSPGGKVSSIYSQYSSALFSSLVASKV